MKWDVLLALIVGIVVVDNWRLTMVEIKVLKLHEDAVLPSAARESDAGFDLVAIDDGKVEDTYIEYRTGIAIETPPGYHTEIFPRSSVSKTDLVLANSIGLVDEGYRGEILVRFKALPKSRESAWGQCKEFWEPRRFRRGDRIAQLVVRKTEQATFNWSEDLSSTHRGTGGFGSTDK